MTDCVCDHPEFIHDEDGCQAPGCRCEEFEPAVDDIQPLDFSHEDDAA